VASDQSSRRLPAGTLRAERREQQASPCASPGASACAAGYQRATTPISAPSMHSGVPECNSQWPSCQGQWHNCNRDRATRAQVAWCHKSSRGQAILESRDGLCPWHWQGPVAHLQRWPCSIRRCTGLHSQSTRQVARRSAPPQNPGWHQRSCHDGVAFRPLN
jgi:hypothetical protein